MQLNVMWCNVSMHVIWNVRLSIFNVHVFRFVVFVSFCFVVFICLRILFLFLRIGYYILRISFYMFCFSFFIFQRILFSAFHHLCVIVFNNALPGAVSRRASGPYRAISGFWCEEGRARCGCRAGAAPSALCGCSSWLPAAATCRIWGALPTDAA